ncbi:MAG TPA: hypothetical protein VF466_05445 [Candidatus Saccharimonadales bacterium]
MTHVLNNTYPTTYAEVLTPLTAEGMDPRGVAALGSLGNKGIEVVMGLTVADMKDVGRIARQPGVRWFCPKDERKRVGDEKLGRTWMEDGRLVFQGKKDSHTVAYGWLRPEECEELPDALETFAVRVDEALAGQGVGVDFSHAIIFGGMARAGSKKVGHETWASNIGAFKTYSKGGAQPMVAKNGWRELPPEHADKADRINEKGVPEQRDTRVWWQWPQSFPEN